MTSRPPRAPREPRARRRSTRRARRRGSRAEPRAPAGPPRPPPEDALAEHQPSEARLARSSTVPAAAERRATSVLHAATTDGHLGDAADRRPPRRSGRASPRGPRIGAERIAARISGRTVGARRSAGPATSVRTSSQTDPAAAEQADQRLRGSTIAPPPGAITRLSSGRSRAAQRLDRRPFARPEARLALLSKISGMRRPAARSISSSRSTNAAPCRAATRRPTAVLPLPGSPTTTSSMRSVVPAGAGVAARRRRRPGSAAPSPAGGWREHASRQRSMRLVTDLGHRVAARLLEHEPGQRQEHHRLADDARRRGRR